MRLASLFVKTCSAVHPKRPHASFGEHSTPFPPYSPPENPPIFAPPPSVPVPLDMPLVNPPPPPVSININLVKGIVISDAMGMKGVVKYFKDGEADVMGIIAGNDILELSENSKRAVKMVRQAIKDQRLTIERIDESVKKILTAKYWAGLHVKQTLNEENVYEGVNRSESQALLQQLADASMTLLRGREFIQALTPNKRTFMIDVGLTASSAFQKEMASTYKNSISFNLEKAATPADIAKVLSQITPEDQVVIAIHDTRGRPGNNLPLSADLKAMIANMATKNAAFVLFANPYNLASMPGIENAKSLLVAYQKEEFMQKAAASVFKNQLIPTGKLPVTASTFFKYGEGL